jgi:hypothetical protein
VEERGTWVEEEVGLRRGWRWKGKLVMVGDM